MTRYDASFDFAQHQLLTPLLTTMEFTFFLAVWYLNIGKSLQSYVKSLQT